MRTISIMGLKGGGAKTTSTIAMSYILATKYFKKVLVIDNDKQGNTTSMLIQGDNENCTIADILTGRGLDIFKAIHRSKYNNIDVITADMRLITANAKIMSSTESGQHLILKSALEPIKDNYDYCIVDNPPDINMSVINALIMTDDVLIPLKADLFSLEGMEILFEQIKDAKRFNPGIELAGCFLTMHYRSKANIKMLEMLRNDERYQKYKLFNTVIRRTGRADDATLSRKPLPMYKCTATDDYHSLTAEYCARIGHEH